MSLSRRSAGKREKACGSSRPGRKNETISERSGGGAPRPLRRLAFRVRLFPGDRRRRGKVFQHALEHPPAMGGIPSAPGHARLLTLTQRTTGRSAPPTSKRRAGPRNGGSVSIRRFFVHEREGRFCPAPCHRCDKMAFGAPGTPPPSTSIHFVTCVFTSD